MQLPEYVRNNPNVKSIIDLATRKRAVRSARKNITEHQVHQVEKHLQALREELVDADRDLQEIDNWIGTARNFFLQAPIDASPGWVGAGNFQVDSSNAVQSDASSSTKSSVDS
jgi:hypothetical protein